MDLLKKRVTITFYLTHGHVIKVTGKDISITKGVDGKLKSYTIEEPDYKGAIDIDQIIAIIF